MAVGNEHSIEELKKIRSTAKANVTRKINRLNELMSSNNTQVVEENKNDLYETVNEFQHAHNVYHEKLENEEEKSNSSQYCAAVLEEGEKHKMKVNLWLSEQNKNKLVDDVQPDDSISNVSSSRSKKSKVSSVRSSASAKARAAARKAALEAKAASLQKLHELQFEELKLQQRKAEIELRAEIAVAEAERKVYEESEVEDMYSLRWPIVATVNKISQRKINSFITLRNSFFRNKIACQNFKIYQKKRENKIVRNV